MFTPKRFSHTKGFTLVELLTVIAIIAILMGILFPTIGAAIESAKKVQAKNDETQIVTAIKGYYTEYGKYPSLDATNPPTTDTTIDATPSDNAKLMDILRNATGGSNLALVTAMNPRKIVFLEAPAVKNDTAGKRKAGVGSDGVFYDPWGNTYKVMIDTDYDNNLINPYKQNAGPATLSTGVIAWTIGRDAKTNSDKNNTDAKDDVISWQ